MLDRASVIDQNFLIALKTAKFPNKLSNIPASASQLSPQEFVQLFESQLISRHLDLRARILKDQGIGFYTIGSSGHEGNAALGKVFRHDDMAFLHYRSGALMAERSRKVPNIDPINDQILSLVAAKDDPISQGRHKVFGSAKLFVPPQTSTIASHLPKAMGAAWSLGRAYRTGFNATVPSDGVILCNFGDASFNHATSQSAFNAAQYLAYKGSHYRSSISVKITVLVSRYQRLTTGSKITLRTVKVSSIFRVMAYTCPTLTWRRKKPKKSHAMNVARFSYT